MNLELSNKARPALQTIVLRFRIALFSAWAKPSIRCLILIPNASHMEEKTHHRPPNTEDCDASKQENSEGCCCCATCTPSDARVAVFRRKIAAGHTLLEGGLEPRGGCLL